MDSEIFTIKTKACITLDNTSADNTIPIFNYGSYTRNGYQIIDEYFQVENLKVISWIYSTDTVAFPVFGLEDTESQQLLTAINLEWGSARIQLDVMLKIDNGEWQRISAYSLLNSSPYPYREYDLGNHSLGNNSMLGLKIRDVGHGLLQNTNNGNDKVTAYADINRVITARKLVNTYNEIENVISNNASCIVNANLNRQGITFFNSSDTNVFLDVKSQVSTSSCMVKLEPGDYYEPPVPYSGAYYALTASGSTTIDIREF